ncbi:endoplasmic reticulum resident protein 27 isoform X2 [Artibeus jamaicensis]|uniref:endoplasmic reticulum resident protein 27 isoform X2 n=1 Tax=Artibeus jamaicensis TaxID=9417 RepID=UPI00235AF95E|nr:endoplasmic reticulum resident protein 27 isoform X2 [Artibeus jamaicensis]
MSACDIMRTHHSKVASLPPAAPELEQVTNRILHGQCLSGLHTVGGLFFHILHNLLLTKLDLEIPTVSIFRDAVQKFPDVAFGISTDPQVLAHYNLTGNTISLFRLVDNGQLNLESEAIKNIDANKLSRFIEINSLRLVTEYNPVTVIGLFNSVIQIHLLLMMNKASPEYEESMHSYQKAAKLFQGKILFILVDSGIKENEKVISYFKLKTSELPALAIYRSPEEEWDTRPMAEVSVELVQNFCDGFLKGNWPREDNESEEKTQKVEL